MRPLRALTAFGIFREVAPSTFANSEASRLFRAGGGLRNYALFATSERFLKSAGALGYSLETGHAAHDHAMGHLSIRDATRRPRLVPLRVESGPCDARR